MRKFITTVLRSILRKIDQDTLVIEPLKESKTEIDVKKSEKKPDIPPSPKKEKKEPSKRALVNPQEVKARDMTEIMEVPFLALSKNRREPIFYEKHNGAHAAIRVKRTHRDWQRCLVTLAFLSFSQTYFKLVRPEVFEP